MSQEARESVTKSSYIFFSADSQRDDLLDENKTSTYLIGMLQHLLTLGHIIGITAIRSDHHDDGPHGHAGGFAFDGWPMLEPVEGSWLDADAPAFREYLIDMSTYSNVYQIGLAGTANTTANQKAAGESWFPDSGADHVHCGVTNGTF